MASYLYYFSKLPPSCQVCMVSKQTIHINLTRELHMRKLKETCNRLVSCLEWPCPSKWHMLENHKIASWSKRQLWAWISVIWLYCLHFYYFSNWSCIGLESELVVSLFITTIFFICFFFCVCVFVYFKVKSFYNPLGFLFISSAYSVFCSFCFIFFLMCT